MRPASDLASLPSRGVVRVASRRSVEFLDRFRCDSLLKNSLFVMATTLATSGFGFVFWVVSARLFSASAVGLTAAITSAATIVVLVSSLGVGGTLIQSLPQARSPYEWSVTSWTGFLVTTVFAAMLAGLAWLALPAMSSAFATLERPAYGVLFVIGTAATAAGAALDYVFIAERRAQHMFSRNAAAAAAKVLLVPAAATAIAAAGAFRLLAAWALAAVVGFIAGSMLVARRSLLSRPPRVMVVLRTAGALRRRFAGHQVIGMGAALLPYVLPLLVTVRLSARDNAYFYTAWMMAGIFLIVSPALSQSLFAEGAHSPEEVGALARSAATIIGAILLPSLVVVLVAGSALLSAFGTEYAAHSVTLLRLALLASIPDAVTNVYVAVLRVQGRLAAAARLNLAMGIGIVALSWLLLPVMGIGAVGCAFLVLQLCGCMYVAWDARVLRRRQATTAEVQ